MYDARKLKNVAECRTVLARARARGLKDVYDAVFRRLCELVGSEYDDPDDPLVRDFYETLAAYEQLLTEKNGKTTIASRTRQKITNKGVHQSLIEWTRGKIETNGFTLLIDAGLPEYTGEYLVFRYGDRFPADVVQLARERLESHAVALPA
jgi:hypothetical protein